MVATITEKKEKNVGPILHQQLVWGRVDILLFFFFIIASILMASYSNLYDLRWRGTKYTTYSVIRNSWKDHQLRSTSSTAPWGYLFPCFNLTSIFEKNHAQSRLHIYIYIARLTNNVPPLRCLSCKMIAILTTSIKIKIYINNMLSTN